ncbi:hypothetical protein NDU88_001681 [Pleurodeles waltl]|uniref:Uncharacterized protein n=1 Tax=Pleurodeles waltl TaxID=8319 RepID=A0AAV7UA67_PLEWA|nr:hypothetical protein NDU88_001681 [Pleurodeles waltl]
MERTGTPPKGNRLNRTARTKPSTPSRKPSLNPMKSQKNSSPKWKLKRKYSAELRCKVTHGTRVMRSECAAGPDLRGRDCRRPRPRAQVERRADVEARTRSRRACRLGAGECLRAYRRLGRAAALVALGRPLGFHGPVVAGTFFGPRGPLDSPPLSECAAGPDLRGRDCRRPRPRVQVERRADVEARTRSRRACRLGAGECLRAYRRLGRAAALVALGRPLGFRGPVVAGTFFGPRGPLDSPPL